ncbi:anthranilate phosphoribosyltransferase [Alkalihalobacillus xiaoxiensis]|uniref:Anthranilate phosphoribosyltransferase n=1 Tax=Shouchella xiaoxiensis TaxID=766895 RepID=A0ABS2T0Z6_9BACI|nr:anthranilate phosphoribosyltransferase [Shouchella xiaoxiensis]MBM7840162.1 anthranilate phosphoribosyltransferase [Shouchella xiaoxiensis]
MIKELIKKCISQQTLTEQEAKAVMLEMMSGTLADSQIASLLTIMRYRGETIEEITGFAKAMREVAQAFPLQNEGLIDTCGTGGDELGTFNISTATAIVLASLNVSVAKHGNRSVSSKSGSADVLEHLGIDIEAPLEQAAKMLEEQSLCFLYAPMYHQSMRHVSKARKEMGIRTIFNIVGPLTNPANADYQLLGVYDHEVAKKLGNSLIELGTTHSLLVTGADGLDECAIHGETKVVEVREKTLTTYRFVPEDMGLERGCLSELQVQSPAESAALIQAIFAGTAPQSARDIVCLNVGAALYARDLVDSIKSGVNKAKEALDSKRTLTFLTYLQQLDRGIKHA